MGEVREVNFKTRLARQRQKAFGKSVLEHIDTQGSDLCGFALVTWNNRGEPMTSFLAQGPIGRGQIPLFIHGAVSQHIAVSLAEEKRRYLTDLDDPA